jgi:hypothetical protein
MFSLVDAKSARHSKPLTTRFGVLGGVGADVRYIQREDEEAARHAGQALTHVRKSARQTRARSFLVVMDIPSSLSSTTCWRPTSPGDPVFSVLSNAG